MVRRDLKACNLARPRAGLCKQRTVQKYASVAAILFVEPRPLHDTAAPSGSVQMSRAQQHTAQSLTQPSTTGSMLPERITHCCSNDQKMKTATN